MDMPLKTYTYDDLLNGLADTDANYYLKSEVDVVIKRIVNGSISMFRNPACCRGLDLKSSLGKIADAAFKHYIRYDIIESENKKLQRELWFARAEICRRFNEDNYIRKHCNSVYWEKYITFNEACKAMSLKLARAEQKCRDMMEKFK